MARQKMGQHFLSSPGWQKRILDTLPLGADDLWIEIGAGHGEMTRLLAAKGRRVIAIEADPRLAANLQEAVRARPDEWPGVEIVAGDVLDARSREIGRRKIPRLRKSALLHHLADSPPAVRLREPDRLDSRRDAIRSRRANRGAPRTPRIRISFRRVPVLRAARDRAEDPAGRVSPASESDFRAGANGAAGRRRVLGHRG